MRHKTQSPISIAKLILIIVIIIVIYLLITTSIKRQIKGGKFKYNIVKKRYALNESHFITTNEPIRLRLRRLVAVMNYVDDNFDMGVETKPDIFWKMVMFKLLNGNLDRQYSYLWENDYQIRILKENNSLKCVSNGLNLCDDIISKIPKHPEKICNLEYNENYYNQHYLKCIDTDMVNIIRLYTEFETKSITLNDMKSCKLNNFKFSFSY